MRVENLTLAGNALEIFDNIKNRVENSELYQAVKNGTTGSLRKANSSFSHQLLISRNHS